MFAHVGAHDVDNHVEEIHHDPATAVRAVRCAGFQAVILAQAVFDLTHDRAQVRLACACCHDKEIGHGRNLPDVEDDDVLGLLVVGGLRGSARDGQRMGNWSMVDSMITDGLWGVYNQYHMGITAENVAKQYSISREAQDALALASQQKAAAAQDAGKFKDEIVPMKTKMKAVDKATKAESMDVCFITRGGRESFLAARTELRPGPVVDTDGVVLAEWSRSGGGLAWRSMWEVGEDLQSGRLVSVLDDWAAPPVGIYAVFPERRHLPLKRQHPPPSTEIDR